LHALPCMQALTTARLLPHRCCCVSSCRTCTRCSRRRLAPRSSGSLMTSDCLLIAS
jgi:hypothetical protein